MVLVTTILFAAIASAKCYEPTTAYPPPDFDPEDAVLKQAFASIQATLESTVSSSDFDWSSFSIEVTSSKESLWSYHHTARERNASRPDIPEVNGDALYRIASITKTFTVLGILHQHQAGKLHLDDPIEKYIKELKEEQDGTLPWKDITLRSLASQLSGIPLAQADIINKPSFLRPPQDVGLPPVSRDGLPQCDEYSPNYETPCRADDLINKVKSQRPVFAPNMKSTYSNVAFELLGLALSRVTGQSYESYIHDAIFKPLGMSKSTFKRPADSAGVIPKDPHFWDVDEGIQNPTGGIYSSLNDMSKYVRYVLTHYNALATGVNWFNVGSAAGGVNGFYGMPWEIFHTDRVFKDSRRAVRFITKGGGLPGYLSIIALAPEYDLGITILVADNTKLLQRILELVSTTIIRAADTISIRQLKERYVDTYSAPGSQDIQNTVFTGSSRTKFVLEANSRGLIVKEFTSNNTDVLRNGFKRGPLSDPWYAQLVPTLLYVDEENKAGQLWRILAVDERSDDGNVWDDFCVSDFDGPFYASTPFNQVVFWDFKDGKYQTVELSAFRRNLTRVSDSTFLDESEVVMEL